MKRKAQYTHHVDELCISINAKYKSKLQPSKGENLEKKLNATAYEKIICRHVSHMLQSKQDRYKNLSRYLKLSQNTNKYIFRNLILYIINKGSSRHENNQEMTNQSR